MGDDPAQLTAVITGLLRLRLDDLVFLWKMRTDELDIQALQSRQSVGETLPLVGTEEVVVMGPGNVDLQRFLLSQVRQPLAGSLEESEGSRQQVTGEDELEDTETLLSQSPTP